MSNVGKITINCIIDEQTLWHIPGETEPWLSQQPLNLCSRHTRLGQNSQFHNSHFVRPFFHSPKWIQTLNKLWTGTCSRAVCHPVIRPILTLFPHINSSSLLCYSEIKLPRVNIIWSETEEKPLNAATTSAERASFNNSCVLLLCYRPLSAGAAPEAAKDVSYSGEAFFSRSC